MDDSDEEEEVQVSQEDRKFFGKLRSSHFLADLDKSQLSKSVPPLLASLPPCLNFLYFTFCSLSRFLSSSSRQARFDADPNALKGKMNRPAAGDYWKGADLNGDGNDDDDDEDDGFDDEDDDEEDDDDHEAVYAKRVTAPAESEARQAPPRLPIKLASGKLMVPTARLEKQGW